MKQANHRKLTCRTCNQWTWQNYAGTTCCGCPPNGMVATTPLQAVSQPAPQAPPQARNQHNLITVKLADGTTRTDYPHPPKPDPLSQATELITRITEAATEATTEPQRNRNHRKAP